MVLYVIMDKLIIKVGANPINDLRSVWKNPTKDKMGKYYTYVNTTSELQSLLSSQRLSLIMEVMKEQNDISTTAKKLGRKQEAISRDATILAQAGIITKTKKGKNTFLKPRIKKIEIDFS